MFHRRWARNASGSWVAGCLHRVFLPENTLLDMDGPLSGIIVAAAFFPCSAFCCDVWSTSSRGFSAMGALGTIHGVSSRVWLRSAYEWRSLGAHCEYEGRDVIPGRESGRKKHILVVVLLVAPAQGTDPTKCDPRLLRRQHFEGPVPWAGARGEKRKKEKKQRKDKGKRAASQLRENRHTLAPPRLFYNIPRCVQDH